MKRRVRRKPISLPTFRRWVRLPETPPEPSIAPLSGRMPARVPTGTTSLTDDGRNLVTVTPLGIEIVWDICGKCGMHVGSCRCTSPYAPRSVTYIWYQDRARKKGEDWSPEHPDYHREFPLPEVAQ